MCVPSLLNVFPTFFRRGYPPSPRFWVRLWNRIPLQTDCWTPLQNPTPATADKWGTVQKKRISHGNQVSFLPMISKNLKTVFSETDGAMFKECPLCHVTWFYWVNGLNLPNWWHKIEVSLLYSRLNYVHFTGLVASKTVTVNPQPKEKSGTAPTHHPFLRTK